MKIKHPQNYREPSLPKFSAAVAALIAATMTTSGAEQPVPLAGVPLPEPTQNQSAKNTTCSIATTNAPTEVEETRLPGEMVAPAPIKTDYFRTGGVMIPQPTPAEKTPKPSPPQPATPIIEPTALEPATSSRLDGDIIIEPSATLPSAEKK